MLSWLYDVFISIITFILGLFGVNLGGKTVTFADDTKTDETPAESSTPLESEAPASTPSE
jgi:hypothetical protein